MSLDTQYDMDDKLIVVIKGWHLINILNLCYFKSIMELYTGDALNLKLTSIVENRGPCIALERYVGPMWHDIQNDLGLIQGKCPIKKVQFNFYNPL